MYKYPLFKALLLDSSSIDLSVTLSVVVVVLAVVVIGSMLVIALLLHKKKSSREVSSSTMDFELTAATTTEKMMVEHYSYIEDVSTPETKAPIYDTPNVQGQLLTDNNVAYGYFNETD